jgi:ectoine hydroxylase-related dioxygenase (phytanoyl-CoA dioxygenase family)
MQQRDTNPLAGAASDSATSAFPHRPAAAQAAGLPLDTRFDLGDAITDVQRAFLDLHGFVVFRGVARPAELDAILAELDRIQRDWLAAGRTHVHGIPLFVGRDQNGEPFIQRFPFTSCFSDVIRDFVRDPRFHPVRNLIGADTRVGDREKDGVVVNRNINVPGSVYPRLGWHTDGLRDLFYLRMPKPMLNVGLHFDRVTKHDGGLRLIPGTHEQGFASTCFRKLYFVSHQPDPEEIAVETEPGDLTVHDGRLWHRVEASPHVGARSLRRTMYVPYLTDAYEPKTDESRTPLYHRLGSVLRALKARQRS